MIRQSSRPHQILLCTSHFLARRPKRGPTVTCIARRTTPWRAVACGATGAATAQKRRNSWGRGNFVRLRRKRELGLLLEDLDEGTLTAYKGGTRLGIMIDGLAGEYVWVSHVLAQAHASLTSH